MVRIVTVNLPSLVRPATVNPPSSVRPATVNPSLTWSNQRLLSLGIIGILQRSSVSFWLVVVFRDRRCPCWSLVSMEVFGITRSRHRRCRTSMSLGMLPSSTPWTPSRPRRSCPRTAHMLWTQIAKFAQPRQQRWRCRVHRQAAVPVDKGGVLCSTETSPGKGHGFCWLG